MKEKRNFNMMFAKSGSGSKTTRATIPVSFSKSLGFKEDDRAGTIEILDDMIIIRKEKNYEN